MRRSGRLLADSADRGVEGENRLFGLRAWAQRVQRRTNGGHKCTGHFQRAMDLVLHGLSWEMCLVYLDDILIFTRTFEEHLVAVDKVFERLASVNLKLKFKKCSLFQREITFLGHVVSQEGLKPDPAKVAAIVEMRTPRNVPEVRRFVGLVGHFRRFIHGFAAIAAPLNSLLHKGTKWHWGREENEAVERLKKCMTTPPVLAHPDMSVEFIIDIDGAGGAKRQYEVGDGKKRAAIGGVLLQKRGEQEVVIEYVSMTLRPRVDPWPATELELTAAVTLVKKWRHYVHGGKFTIRTDHQPLLAIIGEKARTKPFDEPGSKITAQIMKLEPYAAGMRVLWKRGKENTVADAMTRPPVVAAATEKTWQEKVKARAPEGHAYVPVRGDGRCMYAAIGCHVGKPAEEVCQELVRTIIETELLERFRSTVPGTSGAATREQAVLAAREFLKKDVYGEHICLVAASKCYNAVVRVIGPTEDGDKRIEWDEGAAERTQKVKEIVLAWNERADAGGHFDAILPKHPTPREPLQTDVGVAPRAEIVRRQREDEELAPIIEFLLKRSTPDDKEKAKRVAAMAGHMFLKEDGVLYNSWYATAKGARPDSVHQLALPSREWQQKVIAQHHDGPLGGHAGEKKIHERIRGKYWWSTMHKDIKDYVRSCIKCQERSRPQVRYGPLQPIQTRGKWEHVFLDFAGPLPTTLAGNTYIAVMVDGATKEKRLMATKEATAVAAANALVRKVYCRGDTPRYVTSDNASVFKADLTAHTARQLGIEQIFSTPYHPQSHGLVENAIKETLKVLKAYSSEDQRDWDQYLEFVECEAMVNPSDTTGESPFFAIHGYDARLPIDNYLLEPDDQEMRRVHTPADLQDATQRFTALATLQKRLAENIKQAQSKMKRAYDKEHPEAPASFNPGHQVLLEMDRPTLPGASMKLAPRWKGPYEVVAAPSPLNRRIQHTLNKSDVQDVHIARLKPFFARGDGSTPDKIRAILRERRTADGKIEYLVRLRGFTAKDDKWLPAEQIKAEAPGLLLQWSERPLEKRQTPLPTKRLLGPTAEEKKAAKQKEAAEKKRQSDEEKAKKAEETRRKKAEKKKEEDEARAEQAEAKKKELATKAEARKERAARLDAEKQVRFITPVQPQKATRSGRISRPSKRLLSAG